MPVKETTEKQIWNYLYREIKNDYGVAGLMGNLYAESRLYSTNLQDSYEVVLGMTGMQYTTGVNVGTYKNFVNDGAGYGLAQWTYYTRKKALLDFAQKKKVSIGNLNMQLEFLINELKTSFPEVYKTLTTAKSIDIASNAVILNFEKPRDTSVSAQKKRADFGLKFFKKYAQSKIIKETIEQVIAPVVNNKGKIKYNLSIKQAFGTTNTNSKPNRKLEFIVIHYTAGVRSSAGAALEVAGWCKNGGLQSSAEFYVDDATAVQYIQDIPNRHSWSVGGNRYPKITTSLGGRYYGICTNQNSINIEVCNEKTNKKSLSISDTDWYFTEAAINNAVALTRYLMDKYNIDIDHVIMHHMVNGKNCPLMWTRDENSLKGWYDFIEKVKNAEVILTNGNNITNDKNVNSNSNKNDNAVSASYLVQVTANALNIRNGPGIEYKVNGIIRDKGVYTIVEESSGWGRLKSGIGWIKLSYTKRLD